MMNENYLRLIDANLNRLREGIRVVEDVFRYVYNDKQTALKLKDLRHLSRLENYIELLETRDVKNDVLSHNPKLHAGGNAPLPVKSVYFFKTSFILGPFIIKYSSDSPCTLNCVLDTFSEAISKETLSGSLTNTP